MKRIFELTVIAIISAAIAVGFSVYAQQPFTGTPSGVILYMNAACPAGWGEFTAARGNYIVGLPSGGTINTQVGTALTNLENRPVGQHNHTQVGHTHNPTLTTFTNVGSGSQIAQSNGGSSGTGASIYLTLDTQTPTINNTGSVAGTNAPYIHLRVCQKN
jgi:hypothetical protein